MIRARTIRRAAALCVALALGGCIGTTPEDAARARLPRGDGRDEGEDDDDGPEHRPGQPCLVCHTGGLTGDSPAFAIAGTIVASAGGRGVNGALVAMVDNAGHFFCAATNRAGNFMVEVDDGLSAPRQRDDGRLKIPWAPVFPVTVIKVSRSTCDVGAPLALGERTMASLVNRDGSCASCHGPEATARSVGPIVLGDGT